MNGHPAATERQSEDPRVRFAAERTLLAWMRTGLALMGFGFKDEPTRLTLHCWRSLSVSFSPCFGIVMAAYLILIGMAGDRPAW